ncbi:hypothetical protein CERZMDRAFT_92650 [Cercospora zeae-maydis SCOH1-5]|uniref:Uncharacterized protein n=1 Tax=Cercospora zeae-maydis SCOH1-5 TaxID=717836 RepID=A0A6A6FX14_9PEZI|nr:hypothetical protein CERZMDRAFT_92650 [Cercospora zeae-maydis SCOH1-5]
MESHQKRIKICWGTSVQSTSFRQTIVNHNTGTARTWEKQEPSQWKQTGTVLGNPQDPEKYYSERKSGGVPKRQDYKLHSSSISTLSTSASFEEQKQEQEQEQENKNNKAADEKTSNYDTSQL